jgi:ubiquinone/menaquinone biosynthesis C-methylase UbiE
VTAGSVSFDRIADRYDVTRGGLARGERYVAEIAPHLEPLLPPGRRVLEVGVGTGAVARPLTDRGFDVVGVDISRAMLTRAHERIGARVAEADAHRLPFPDTSVDGALTIWVLHLVADPAGVVAEIARVLRPGGRFVVMCADAVYGEDDGDDLAPITHALDVAVGRFKDAPRLVRSWAAATTLRLLSETRTAPFEFSHSPEETVAAIESRSGSAFWDLTDAQWQELVQPRIDELLALPEPARRRNRTLANPMLAFERTA